MEGQFALAARARWAADQFGSADLGDVRRTRRLVKLATQMAGHSSGSIPQQAGQAADVKAAYRLFAGEGVTHEAVCRPHFQQTRQAAGSLPWVFLVQDTTELDFTKHVHCQGLGPIGGGHGLRGLHQQNVLAVDPVLRRPLGLLYQRHHRRTERPAGHRGDRSRQRRVPLAERESYWWIEAIRAMGSPPPGVRWVHVGDRGEDLFGVYDQARSLGTDWLIRVAQNRRVETPTGSDALFSYARQLPASARRRLTVRRKPNGVTEEVELSMAAGPVTLRPSRSERAYRHLPAVACWVVRVWETHPVSGAAPLEWLLCTSLPCSRAEETAFVAEGYSLRWLIEEFHKCAKTGCQVEARRLEHADRLEPLIGLLSVLAVWLLQLKFVARDHPEQPASTLFDEETVEVMACYLKKPAATLTAGEFWRGIGRLGGHLGRRGDGPLGWLRAWRGWQSFQFILLGASLYRDHQNKRCG